MIPVYKLYGAIIDKQCLNGNDLFQMHKKIIILWKVFQTVSRLRQQIKAPVTVMLTSDS